jgi:DNA-directed RNA polymerase subunit RPC12/RpoP
MENLCNNCIHKDVCGRYAATWGMKTCENFMEMPKRGHKVVHERYRGTAYAMECPICNSRIPSNKPYAEKVEYCSECGKKLDDTFQNFCPNCGADMRGAECE